MSLLSAFARSDWLTPRRARFYATASMSLTVAFLLWVGVLSVLHAARRPVALDFAAFWAAAQLALAGHPADAYDPSAIEAVERASLEMAPGYLAFYYPPTTLLLLLPLGLVGYGAALAMFLAAEMALVLAALRRILPQRWAWLAILGFPGFFMNGLSGQNAGLSAACFAGAAIWLERFPLLAGACLGALACKPQLAACVPVALLSARRWRALASCAATAAGLALASVAALGTGAWRGFLHGTALARTDIETIAIKWPKMQSVFGAVRLSGGGNATAYAAQAVVSLIALAVLAWTCAKRPGPLLEASALATATLLVTPFLYDYDLAILAVPLACIAALAARTGWRSWEHFWLAPVFVLPLAARPAGLLLGLTLGPPLIAALLVLVARRTLHLARDAR